MTNVSLGHTKDFLSLYMPLGKLLCHFIDYMRDQLILDDQLEDAKIILASDSQFHSDFAFKCLLQPGHQNDADPDS